MSRRPLIAITTSEVRVPANVAPTPEGEPPRREMALGLQYCRAVENAGGVPVVMPPLDGAAIDALLDRVSGVCLSGGPDIDPGTYEGHYHPKLGPTEPELDLVEIALTRAAYRRRMPILAICRGAQMLNVALGGDLLQHLPEDVGPDVEHRRSKTDGGAMHSVSIASDSRLARAMAVDSEAEVNSFHHQAVRELGAPLQAVAWAPDGVVEGIEASGRDFVVGVQWHAESLQSRPEQAALISAFVDASRRYDSPPQDLRRAA
jgi:putative glutamine amidotransferase